MTRREVSTRVRSVIIRELQCPPARIRDDADFRRDLGADSLDMVGLPAALEEEFKISISDDEAEFCQSVGTAIDLIVARLENGGAR